ncbi:MAG: hypothetical protein K9W43_06740 [Candidatus Thorarchaeota archaeon]|nr:hypothetical protein [Candidatus Thorarchaeota archaeon]
MSTNAKTHERLQHSLVQDLIAVFLSACAVVIWPMNKIISLVLLMVVLYIIVIAVGNLFFDRMQREPTSVDLDSLRQMLAERSLDQPGDMARFSIRASSIYEADTSSLSLPSDGAAAEVPMPPSIVVEDESVTDEDFFSVGIRHLRHLADISPEELSQYLDIDESEAEDLIYRANLLYYGANVQSLMDLAMMTPKEIILKIENGPWSDIYSSDDDLSYLEEMADRWIQTAKVVMARSLTEFFRGRKNL